MRYNWDYKELSINHDLLQAMCDSLDDERIKHNIKTSMNLYINMAKMVNKNGIKIFDDAYDDDNIVEMINGLVQAYDTNAARYLQPLLNSFFITRNYEYDTKKAYEPIKDTNDDLVYLTEDFFNTMTTPEIVDEFKSILDKKNKIQISYDRSNSNYAGLTLIDDVLKEKYIYMGRKNILLDITLLPHEAFHYIFINEDLGINPNYNTRYLAEVEGMFSNILFGKYYKNITANNDTIFTDYNNAIFQEHIEDLVVKQAILNALNDKKKIRLNKLNKFLERVSSNIDQFVDTNGLTSYLELPQDIVMTYALSNLIAIDLYYKYLEDREKAFYLLRCIKDCPPTNKVFKLLKENEITFMSDDYTNLKKYLKEKKF